MKTIYVTMEDEESTTALAALSGCTYSALSQALNANIVI